MIIIYYKNNIDKVKFYLNKKEIILLKFKRKIGLLMNLAIN